MVRVCIGALCQRTFRNQIINIKDIAALIFECDKGIINWDTKPLYYVVRVCIGALCQRTFRNQIINIKHIAALILECDKGIIDGDIKPL